MNTSLIKLVMAGVVFGLLPVVASAELVAMQDSELRDTHGQGLVINIGNGPLSTLPMYSVAIPELSEMNVVIGPVAVSERLGNFKTNHPNALPALGAKFTTTINTAVLTPLNEILAMGSLRFLAPIQIVQVP
jgi:hypothetical protein